MVFTSEKDARRIYDVLPKRFGKYGLTLHRKTTRLVRFLRPRPQSRGKGEDHGRGTPSNFDLFGFRHYWGRSRKGRWVVKRKTALSRFSRTLRRISDWCRRHRHWPITEQHTGLCLKVKGHCAYYGITGNSQALLRFDTRSGARGSGGSPAARSGTR